jgi:hypothetical protein
MGQAAVSTVTERRKDRRYGADEARALSARVRPGHDVVLVDVSVSGALIEVASPLRPGALVHVQFRTSTSSAGVIAHVTRCAVGAITNAGIRYRAALQFDHRSPWISELVTPSGRLGT